MMTSQKHKKKFATMELIKNYREGKLTTADIRTHNNIVICLMVLVAICSILWSISLHILSANFYDGIISAKLVFHGRDFTHLDNSSKHILHEDLSRVLQQSHYFDEQEQREITTSTLSAHNSTMDALLSESQTKKPKVHKIEHVYESKENAPILARLLAQQTEMQPTTTTNAPPKIVFNRDADRQFLAGMSVDAHATHWSQGASAQFVYAFPFISEIVAIIWTAMCLIFQTGIKKTWGLPKPWRIVVPSIAIFLLMSLSSLAYTILANGHLKRLCSGLRSGLTNPTAISCGDAMALLRPYIREHRVSMDVHLELFRISYSLSMVLWILALLVMVLRYLFAVDFQLVDIDDMFERKAQPIHTYTEVLQHSPQHQLRPKSEDDFQSAKSRLSDSVTVTPLLDPALQPEEQRRLTTLA